MERLRSFIIKILNVFRRSRIEADLRDQLQAHRELIKADLMSRGMDGQDADAAARRALGNEQLVREFTRDEMLHRWMENVGRDIRFGLRRVVKMPVFAVTIVLTLALGIGANTAIFSMVDRVLLRPLPFPDAEQLMLLYETGQKAPRMDVNPSNWLDWQRQSQTFEGFAAWTDRIPATLTGQEEPERLKREAVSYEFFGVLGVKPLLGRDFTAEDDRPRDRARIVLSHSLWQRKFAGDSNIIGKMVELDAVLTRRQATCLNEAVQ